MKIPRMCCLFRGSWQALVSCSHFLVTQVLSFHNWCFLILFQGISISIQPTSHQDDFCRAGNSTQSNVFLIVHHCLLPAFKYFRAHGNRKEGCAHTMANAFYNTTVPNSPLVLFIVHHANTEWALKCGKLPFEIVVVLVGGIKIH